MAFIVPEAIEAYAVEHSDAPTETLRRLSEETRATQEWAQMMVGPIEGGFLKALARMSGARRALEIGTFTGYSALSIAAGLAEDGKLTCLDANPDTSAIARRFFDESGLGDRIELIVGDARESLKAIEGPLDFVFIDADKAGYVHYWDTCVPLLRPGGVIVVDNVLWSGRVLDPESESDHAIVAFNRHAAADERVDRVMLTVRDGMLLAIRR